MLIVAIHDVAPSELAEVRWLLGQLDAVGVDRRVLKVVPAGPEQSGQEELLDLLRREQQAGSELVLHGWSHRSAGRLRGSAPDRLRALLFAREGAEFLTLDDAEVWRRVRAGRDWLSDRGLTAIGFCPPAWLATPALEPALRQAGFEYLLTLARLRALTGGRQVILPPTGYMGAGSVQEALVRIAGSVVSRPLGRLMHSPAHRIFMHPQGASSSPDCARVLARVARLAASHRSITYADLL